MNTYLYFNRTHSLRRRNVGVYLGCKLSSKLGLALNTTAAALGAVYAILYAVFSSYEGNWSGG